MPHLNLKRTLLALSFILISIFHTEVDGSLLVKPKEIRTLVLLDSWITIETHSIFFSTLKHYGHTITYEMITDNTTPPQIKYYDEYFYDNIILMAPSLRQMQSPLSEKDLVDFLQKKNPNGTKSNIMIVADIDSKKVMRNLFNDFGLDLENVGFILNDFESEAGNLHQQPFSSANTIYSKNLFEKVRSSKQGTFTDLNQPVAYSGIGHYVDPGNQFVFPILRAEQTTFSFNSDLNQVSPLSGEMLTLVSGYQTRKNQRASFSGSLAMCSNEYILMTIGENGSIESSSNYQFCKDLSLWNFQQKGVIKATNMRHNKKGEKWTGVNPENHKIWDEIEFYVDVETLKVTPNGPGLFPTYEWVPYFQSDIQLSMDMLDPWYILNLKKIEGSTYRTEFRVPHRIGIYKLQINYWRYGFSFIDEQLEVSFIPFRHDEFPRFLPKAYPYYINAFAVMGATFLFIAFFLYGDYSQPSASSQSSLKDKKNK